MTKATAIFRQRREALTKGGLLSKNQHSQEDAEDQDDEEDRDRNKEENLCNRPEVSRNAGEAKETGGERNEKEDDGPLDHERSPASRVISVPRTAFDNDRDDRVDRVFFGGLFRSAHRR